MKLVAQSWTAIWRVNRRMKDPSLPLSLSHSFKWIDSSFKILRLFPRIMKNLMMSCQMTWLLPTYLVLSTMSCCCFYLEPAIMHWLLLTFLSPLNCIQCHFVRLWWPKVEVLHSGNQQVLYFIPMECSILHLAVFVCVCVCCLGGWLLVWCCPSLPQDSITLPYFFLVLIGMYNPLLL